jgi:dipeptidyl aminopeptidase/acylaminoacyl peptidase
MKLLVTKLFLLIYSTGFGEGAQFDLAEDLTDDQVVKMKRASPALNTFDPKSKTKILLALGKIDRRVPPKAGYYLYRKLKKLGFDIFCKDYDG